MSAVLEAVRPIENYLVMTDEEVAERIEFARRELGSRVVILGHHYQRDDVIRHADLTGDSYQLSVMASQTDAEYIVFCGVHFMAESADVLGKPHQRVILPDLGAGCSMADMANIEQVEDAWQQLREIGVLKSKVAPITYMNSTAAIKAFCGRNDGVVCTSSNAVPLFDVYLKEYDKMFFFPDQHLGRNTGAKFGIPLDKMALWNPHEELGGNTEEELHEAKLILWRGHCSVHGRFKPWHVDQIRKQVPGVQVLVHPECAREVVEISDLNGSTSFIINTVEKSPAGSKWAIGTEVNLVNRLAQRFPDKEIHLLAPDLCMCATMYRIAPQNLAWSLENLLDGNIVNEIKVDDETKHFALVALERMINLTEKKSGKEKLNRKDTETQRNLIKTLRLCGEKTMAEIEKKLPENVRGKYYVDAECIDCDVCRDTSPRNFTRDDENGYSFVYRQPETPEEIELCEEALTACPVEAIGDDGK